MEKIPEFLKNNDHYLKSCILYEVLQKKPIFDSYRTFCNTVGQDAMEYRDFEFRYHRFGRGELDFDYARSLDPVPKTLMDMPANLMQKITKDLDPFERSYLRLMNHGLKSFIDSFPTVFKRHIYIDVLDKELVLRLNGKKYGFEKEGDGCKFSTPKNDWRFEKSEKSYIQKGLEYLTLVFKIPNLQTDLLWWGVTDQTSELDDLLPVPFFAKSAFIVVYNFDKMVRLLTSLKPGHLEEFKLHFKEPIGKEHFTRVFETEQFKQAESVEIHRIVVFDLEDLVSFSHLKSFTCGLTSITEPEEILQIRDTISTFKDIEWCKISYRRNGTPIGLLAEVLEEEVPEGPLESFTHRYENPESKKTLEFKIQEKREYCDIDIRKIL
ncbi:Protein CBG04791 [Caenorhabditis briggsae]|uniref:Protein CBG04791 n=1 Tax=Caenorhabditis briggsae TaxID=6238 RepID=A8WYH3_CAEBR|nr:Protein CBG04791 [Caenorhabditis briggsae]CAP25431.2 Protein CBG04791 [Caenorhabditis briggsae]